MGSLIIALGGSAAIVFRQWGEWSGPGKVHEKCDAIRTKALREKLQDYNA
jgi:hypothetical protein